HPPPSFLTLALAASERRLVRDFSGRGFARCASLSRWFLVVRGRPTSAAPIPFVRKPWSAYGQPLARAKAARLRNIHALARRAALEATDATRSGPEDALPGGAAQHLSARWYGVCRHPRNLR